MKTAVKFRQATGLVFLACVLLTVPAHAALIRVPQDKATIQAAIDASRNGDTVEIADGVYTGAGNVNIDFKGRSITVTSQNGPANCIVDCQEVEGVRGFIFDCCEQTGAVLNGLTIRNGHIADPASGGGGIYCHRASPIITDCIIENCRAQNYGGGIFCLEASPVIQGCIFRNNQAVAGAGVLCNVNAAPVIADCEFTDNSSEAVGSSICAYNAAKPQITGCVISGTTGSGIWINTAGAVITDCRIFNNSKSGIAVANSTDTTIVNCILRDNEFGLWCHVGADIAVYNCLVAENQGYGGVCCAGSSPVIVNCTIADNIENGINCFDDNESGRPATPTFINSIIWGNADNAIQNWSSGSPIFLYSNLQEYANPPGGDSILDTYPGGTNISEPPQFATDYALSAASPCVNAGRNADNTTAMDLAGHERIRSGVIDMGAYEYGALAAPDPTPDNVLFVKPGATGNGVSWLDPTDLQSALDQAESGDEIWLAGGVYKPTVLGNPGDGRNAAFTLKNGVALYGGFQGNESRRESRDWQTHATVLSGDIDNNDATDANGVTVTINGANAYHVLISGTGNDETAVIDGFTITGGYANGPPGADSQGGGMLNWQCTPTVRNCRFIMNQAMHGGGMMNSQSSPTVAGCVFEQNAVIDGSDGSGGAMNNYDNSSPLIAGCAFSNNSSPAQGGAMAINGNSNPDIRCCTFSNNTAQTHGGAILIVGGAPMLTKCDFEYNTGQWGGAVMNAGASPNVTDCTFTENSAVDGGNGGAINNDSGSSPVIDRCTFTRNSAQMQGGAVINNINSNPVFTDCLFSENTASNGGGVHNVDHSAPEITGCDFIGNQVTTQGGAIVNITQCDADISDCTFQNNTAMNGGAVFTDDSSPTIADCLFSENQADADGGGMYTVQADAAKVLNCSFHGNTAESDGGAVYNESGVLDAVNTVFSGNAAASNAGGVHVGEAGAVSAIINCSFTANSALSGDGIYVGNSATATVTNTVLWENGATDIAVSGGVATVSHSLLSSSWIGTGNKIGNPLFTRSPDLSATPPDYGDLRLTACSPTVNAGDNSAVAGIPTDRNGDTRIVGAAVDMGAYENQGELCVFTHPSLDPQYVVMKLLYDDFQAPNIDLQKWAPSISGDPAFDTYAIVNQAALLTTEGDGKRVVRMTAQQFTDSPYLEAAVTVKTGSTIAGDKSRARLSGFFYNDTYAETDAGNGYQGDVYGLISICHYPEGLKVRYMVGRFPTESVETEEVLAIGFFAMPIQFDRPYRLSISLENKAFVFACVDTVTAQSEQKTYTIDTPVHPAKMHSEELKLMARIDAGSTGKLIAAFDDVYVARYLFVDVNDDKEFSLADVITALKILAGFENSGVSLQADMNGDGKIGMEEVLLLLRLISGI